MGMVLFTACSGFLGLSWTMVLDRPTRLATELLDWMSCSFSSCQGQGGWRWFKDGEERSLPGFWALPPPQCWPARAEQTRQEDPAALAGRGEGSGDGMGRRTDITAPPSALQSHMHTVLSGW